ncbi:MAG: MBL fold metallo-hydrolase [Candidatus Bipolaricaulota bacterium]
MGTHSVEAIVLGIAQDGGIPQLGCDCPHCRAAWRDGSLRRLVVSLGIVDHEAKTTWMVDASPDICEQMNLLVSSFPGYRLAGLLLTHAHVGHYLGLALLGRESRDTRNLPVLCKNQPWKQLVDLGNIELSIVESDRPVGLGSTATATPVLVPHRDEHSDTVAWSIAGPTKTLVYCPDVDRWEGRILEAIEDADIALLDGTFYSTDELPGRDISKIPHPCVIDSIKTFEGWAAEIRFIHLNHTNPLLSDEGLVPQLGTLGFGLGKRGDRWIL